MWKPLTASAGTGAGGGAAFSFITFVPISGTSPTAESDTDSITFLSSDGAFGIAGDSAADSLDFTLNTVAATKGGTGLTSYTAGDLIYSTAANTLGTLPKGTANQLLRMNAGATAPEWATIAGGGDVVGPASSTANANARFSGTTGKLLKDGKWLEDDNGHVVVDLGDTSTTTTRYGTYITQTLTGTASTINAAERLDLTTAGSGAAAFLLGRWTRLLGGYTGNGLCAGDWVLNNISGVGTDINGGAGVMGYRSVLGGSSTTGHAAGVYVDVAGGWARGFGVLAELEGGGSSGIGVGFGAAVYPGSGTYRPVGFWARLSGTVSQVPNTAGAAVLDNAATTHPMLVCQDNGTSGFVIADGCQIWTNQTSTGTTPGTVTNKMPIYNATGTLVGYIAIYDAIT